MHEPIKIKPISEVAQFHKNLIPINIPATYALKPAFKNLTNVCAGVIAFRDFLLEFCDRLASDGHLYAKPPKKPTSMADYPFINHVCGLLVEIGYNGKLAEDGDLLVATALPPKIPKSSLLNCMKFLSLCGFIFTGIGTETEPLEVSFPDNPMVLTGLKAMAIADMELRTGRRYSNDNYILGCDYRLLKAEESDMGDVLADLLQTLPAKIRDFVLNLHKRYIDMGLTCITTRLGSISFAYVFFGTTNRTLSERDLYAKRVWEINYSIRNSYCLFVRAKKTDKYADVIKTFPVSLQEKIAQGYGCYRKLGRNRCQVDCQGIRIPLDESILDMAEHIETWLDAETPNALKKEA